MDSCDVVRPDDEGLLWLGGIRARTLVPGAASEGMAAVTARYGLELDLASMPELVERFDLARPPEMDG